MALSFCSFNHHQELTVYPHTEVDTDDHQLLGYNENFMSTFSDSIVNPLFEFDDELFYSDSYTNLLPYFSSSPSDNVMSLSSPDIFPLQEFESYQYPKRQKSYADICHSSFAPSFFDGYVIANSDPVLPEFPAPVLPKFQVPAAAFNGGRSDWSTKKPSGESLSAQSIAARERRRKITEKTQELGKLIPGGNKMNTAEMLQAASKYVKFLQAQVKLLQLMESMHQDSHLQTHELQILLASPMIQEKLYSQEKCLVPKEFLQTIANGE
ncbi:transcription factor bHLH52-like [Hevea brasiliensis]|uniref:transcription factor bHLH52-like n=1 Tax=Hevea brasiliensis TaxID=3981 RepID=UPI0025F8834E|nr:transcription factor bHLH52-like [Hevea brasiliensis]